jgi:hypothetical protein
VRAFLVFAAMDVNRAYLYFFNDADEPSFHASSGITRNFQPPDRATTSVVRLRPPAM